MKVTTWTAMFVALFVTMFGGLALTIGAHAQNEGAKQRDPLFVKLDKNGDGYVSRGEAAANGNVSRIFTKADLNKDGRLDEDEFAKAESLIEREKAGAYTDDATITTKVKAALLQAKGVKSTDISVTTTKGVVLLSGFVEDPAQASRAGHVASGVGGVREVRNTLQVKPK
jgi:hyperosmotically inducible periplasmic protein